MFVGYRALLGQSIGLQDCNNAEEGKNEHLACDKDSSISVKIGSKPTIRRIYVVSAARNNLSRATGSVARHSRRRGSRKQAITFRKLWDLADDATGQP